jgi:hypothetical protein
MNPSHVIAYHFVAGTLRDGRPVPPDGQWLSHFGPVIPCQQGLHASRHVFDALLYAPGHTLCLVECGFAGAYTLGGVYHAAERIVEDADKLACSARRIIARLNAKPFLQDFARRVGLDVAHLDYCPPELLEWLETGEDHLLPAADAAVGRLGLTKPRTPAIEAMMNAVSATTDHTQSYTVGAVRNACYAHATSGYSFPALRRYRDSLANYAQLAFALIGVDVTTGERL